MTIIAAQTEYIPLAMLNALAYCPRRFCYEHIQAEMLVNDHVWEGALRHQGVDLGGNAWVAAGAQQRHVYVWSERLRIAGLCDIVEEQDGQQYPVEYKKGRPGRWASDRAQLCAQAICLEERTGGTIASGTIFYFATRRREGVIFDAPLRAEVERLAHLAHALAAQGALAPPTDMRAKCRDCSLQPLCLPDELRMLATHPSAAEADR